MKRSRDYRRGEKYQNELNCRRNNGMRSISGGIHTFPVDLCECDRLIVRDRLKLIQMFFFYSLSLQSIAVHQTKDLGELFSSAVISLSLVGFVSLSRVHSTFYSPSVKDHFLFFGLLSSLDFFCALRFALAAIIGK